jgi:hypothetical protein
VLARLHRSQRDQGVPVVRRRDQHRVDVLLLLEHHPVVLVHHRLRELLDRPATLQRLLGGRAFVEIDQGSDVVALGHVQQVGGPHAVDVADDGHVDGVAGGLKSRAEHVAWNDGEAGGRGRGGGHELAA